MDLGGFWGALYDGAVRFALGDLIFKCRRFYEFFVFPMKNKRAFFGNILHMANIQKGWLLHLYKRLDAPYYAFS